jgi:excisionase family DNA binding protein
MTVLILIFCKLLYSREEAAEILNISLRKVDELVANGMLTPRRIDNSVRFYVGELIRFASLNSAEPKGADNAVEDADDHAA